MEHHAKTMIGWFINLDYLESLTSNGVLNLKSDIDPQPFNYDHTAMVEYIQKILDAMDGELVVVATQDGQGNVIGFVIGDVISNQEFEYVKQCHDHFTDCIEIANLFKITDPVTIISYLEVY